MSRTDKDRPFKVRESDPLDILWDPPVEQAYPEIWRGYKFNRRTWFIYQGAPPNWFVKHVYHAPRRTEERADLRAAVKDWNANGDTDIEPYPWQGRNSARYYWW